MIVREILLTPLLVSLAVRTINYNYDVQGINSFMCKNIIKEINSFDFLLLQIMPSFSHSKILQILKQNKL